MSTHTHYIKIDGCIFTFDEILATEDAPPDYVVEVFSAAYRYAYESGSYYITATIGCQECQNQVLATLGIYDDFDLESYIDEELGIYTPGDVFWMMGQETIMKLILAFLEAREMSIISFSPLEDFAELHEKIQSLRTAESRIINNPQIFYDSEYLRDNN